MTDAGNITLFTVTGYTAGAILLGISVFLLKRGAEEKFGEWKARREAWEAHIKECNEKKIHTALTDQKIKEIESQLVSGHNTFQWLGDCVVRIGAKLDVDLPTRPRE